MTDHQHLKQVCGWNRQLARQNAALRAELHRVRLDVEQLEAANGELRVERDAADVLLGEAMDAALGSS
jgi:hypothetical protein